MSTKKNDRIASERQFRSGVTTHLKTGVHFDSKQHSQKEVIALLVEREDASLEVIATKAAYEKALAVETKVLAETASAYSAVRAAVHVMFGNSPDILVEFGLTQRRTARARTLDEKVVARDKRDLTRAARHEMGKKQRAAIRPAPPEPIPTAPQPAAQAPAIPPSPIVPQSLVNGAGSH